MCIWCGQKVEIWSFEESLLVMRRKTNAACRKEWRYHGDEQQIPENQNQAYEIGETVRALSPRDYSGV